MYGERVAPLIFSSLEMLKSSIRVRVHNLCVHRILRIERNLGDPRVDRRVYICSIYVEHPLHAFPCTIVSLLEHHIRPCSVFPTQIGSQLLWLPLIYRQ
jgi:hypothetical protein